MALQPYSADPLRPSASAAPSYFTAAALRAGYAVAAPPPPAAHWDALHRELHDERVREDYFAREIARSRLLLDQRLWHQPAPIYPSRTEFGAASVPPQRVERLPYFLEAGVGGRPVERQLGYTRTPAELGYTRTPAALRPEAVIRKQRPLVNHAVVSRAESTLPQKSSGIKRKAVTTEAVDQKLSGIKRKAATTEAVTEAVNDPPQQVKKWKCSLCRIITTSERDLKSHFQGQKHKAVQESEQELKHKAVQESLSSESKVADKSLPEDGLKEVNKQLSRKLKVKRWSCSLCRVFTSSEQDLKSHLQGQKHKAIQESEHELKSYLQGQKPKAVQESRSSESKVADKSLPADGLKEVDKQLSTNIAKEADGLKEVNKQLSTNIVKEYFFCDVCKLQCNSQTMLNGHLNGKKHKEVLFNSRWSKVPAKTDKQGLIAKKQKATHESHGSPSKVADKVLPVDGSKQVNKLLSTNHVPEEQKQSNPVPKEQKQSNPVPKEKKLFCEVCKVKCTSQFDLNSHLNGKRHRETLTLSAKEPGNVTSAGTYKEVDKETKPGVQQKRVLKSKRKSLTDLKSPLNGKKHKAQLLKTSEDNKLDKPAKLELQSFNCDDCNLKCNSLSNLKLHLNGKKHKAQLEELNKVQDDKPAIAEQSGKDSGPVSVEESGKESKAVNAAEPATAEQSGND